MCRFGMKREEEGEKTGNFLSSVEENVSVRQKKG